jgi:hypothetical protein
MAARTARRALDWRAEGSTDLRGRSAAATPERRHYSPGCATRMLPRDPAIRAARRNPPRRRRAKRWALRMTAAQTNHPGRRRMPLPEPLTPDCPAAAWDGRQSAARPRPVATAPDQPGESCLPDQTASVHRLVLVVEMKKAPAVGSLWLLGGSNSERAPLPRPDGRAPQRWVRRSLRRNPPVEFQSESLEFAAIRESGANELVAVQLMLLILQQTQKNPVRFPGRAHFVSFNFLNRVIADSCQEQMCAAEAGQLAAPQPISRNSLQHDSAGFA